MLPCIHFRYCTRGAACVSRTLAWWVWFEWLVSTTTTIDFSNSPRKRNTFRSYIFSRNKVFPEPLLICTEISGECRDRMRYGGRKGSDFHHLILWRLKARCDNIRAFVLPWVVPQVVPGKKCTHDSDYDEYSLSPDSNVPDNNQRKACEMTFHFNIRTRNAACVGRTLVSMYCVQQLLISWTSHAHPEKEILKILHEVRSSQNPCSSTSQAHGVASIQLVFILHMLVSVVGRRRGGSWILLLIVWYMLELRCMRDETCHADRDLGK